MKIFLLFFREFPEFCEKNFLDDPLGTMFYVKNTNLK